MEVLCDNQAAIHIAKILVHHDRTKHIEVNIHFRSEKSKEKIIDLNFIPTHLQVASILTKALHRPVFEDLSSRLGMINMTII